MLIPRPGIKAVNLDMDIVMGLSCVNVECGILGGSESRQSLIERGRDLLFQLYLSSVQG